jgi:hypothetical protein
MTCLFYGERERGGGLLLDPDGTLVHVKDHPKVGQVKELGSCGWPGVYRQITSLPASTLLPEDV